MLRAQDQYQYEHSSSLAMMPTCPQHAQDSHSESVDLRSARNSAVAGYAAGITGVVFGHPLDSAKVWIQTNSAGRNKHLAAIASSNTSSAGSMLARSGSASMLVQNQPAASGTASMSTMAARPTANPLAVATSTSSSFSKSLRTLRALYSGVSGPLVTVGIVQSINFTTYDAMRRILHKRDHPEAASQDYLQQDSLTNVGIAGFVAGMGLAFVTSPLILVKTRQQVTGQGFRQAFSEALLSPTTGRLNISGCMVGIYPHLLSETLGRSMYYMSYEALKRRIQQYKQAQLGVSSDAKVSANLWERMASAGTSGILCWSLIYPLDSLRNRLYSQTGLTSSTRLGTWEMAKLLYKEGALYRGFGLTIVRAGPVAAAVLPVYDSVLEMMASRDY